MYFVIEHNKRDDGIVNTTETARSSFSMGLSLFFERCSKAAASKEYVKSAVMLVDEDLNEIEHRTFDRPAED